MRIFIIFILSSSLCLAGRHQISTKITKIYSYKIEDKKLILVCDAEVDRPLEATSESSEIVHCFTGQFQNMITAGKRMKLVLNHGTITQPFIERIQLKELDEYGCECSYIFGGHGDELVFKGGKLHSVEFCATFAREQTK